MKFLLCSDAYHLLRSSMVHYGQPDRFGINGKYHVFSQYFDSESLRFFYDKMDGEWEHIKIRVRQYGNEFGKKGIAFLEAKIKHNIWQQKLRIRSENVKSLLDVDSWDQVAHPDIDFFLSTSAQHALVPACNVYYEREAYTLYDGVDPIRFNFDTNACFLYPREQVMNADLLEDRRMLKEHQCILEIKTQSECLPDFLQSELLKVGAQLTTFSKYTTALLRLDEWNRHNEVHV